MLALLCSALGAPLASEVRNAMDMLAASDCVSYESLADDSPSNFMGIQNRPVSNLGDAEGIIPPLPRLFSNTAVSKFTL